MRTFVILTLTATVALAADPLLKRATQDAGSLTAPVLGYIARADATELRPLLGTVESVRVGSRIGLPENVARVFPSPTTAFVALLMKDGVLRVLQLPSLGLLPISGSSGVYDQIVMSPRGRSLAAISTTRGRIDIVTGLPDAPRVDWSVSAVASSTAISDDGALALWTTSNGTVELARREGTKAVVYSGAEISSLSFQPSAANGVILEASQGSVILVSGLNAAPATRVLAQSLAFGKQARAGFSLNGDRLIVSSPDAGVVSIDPNSGLVETVALAGTATDLRLLGESGVLTLAPPDVGSPGWLLTVKNGRSQSSMVPGIPYDVENAEVTRGRRR